MPQQMRPLPPPTLPGILYFTAACPACGHLDATWRHHFFSSRTEYAIFCLECGTEVAWNSRGTEVAI